MKSIGAYEAKTHLSDLLDDVEAGEDITITRYGKPVARLVPASQDRESDTGETIEALKEFREGRRLDSADLDAMIEEGRA